MYKKNQPIWCTAAYRSLSPQYVITRKSWDRLSVVNKSDIYSWSPCKGREFHSIYFSIMTIQQCDSVAKAFSLMPVSFYIEPYLLIFLSMICASSWRRKLDQCSLFSAFLSKPTAWNNLILLLALVGYGINRQHAFIFLHVFLQINVMH